MKRILTICATLAFAACGSDKSGEAEAPADAPPASPVAVEVAGGNPAAEQASFQITDPFMREIIVEISDDSYEGRGPGTRGDVKARNYLAERMQEIGLLPGAADGSWEQPFDLVSVNAQQPDSWTFEGHGQTLTLQQWDEFIVGSGVQEERIRGRRAGVRRLCNAGARI